MTPNTRGKSTRQDTRRRRKSPSSPLLGPLFKLVLLAASWCILHHTTPISNVPWIRRREVRAEHHPTIPRSNNRYTHYHYSGSSSTAASDGGLETSSGGGAGKSETFHSPPSHHHFHPPWNPSPKIDPNGFLSDAYVRCPGEWEHHANIRGRHGPGGGGRGILNNKDRRVNDELLNVPVMVRQVPGDGNCLFHSISACLHHAVNGTHLPMNTHDRVGMLRRASLQLRNAAVDVLQQRRGTWGGGIWAIGGGGRRLFLQGEEYLEASELLSAAAAQFDLTGEEYCELMRKECYWGGGPEIVALCNYLQRPIHIYELIPVDESTAHRRVNGQSNSNLSPSSRSSSNNDGDVKFSTNRQFALRRMACFGSPKFDRREPLHILSADSRFPDVDPHRIRRVGNHFMALFPVDLSCKVDTGGDGGGVHHRFTRHALIGRGGCRNGPGTR